MSVVGRAYVTVRAVTRQVEGDIDKGVSKALDRAEAKMDKSGEGMGGSLGDGIGKGVKKSKVDEKIHESVHEYAKRTDNDGNRIGNALGKAIGDSLFEKGPIEKALRKGSSRARSILIADGDDTGAEVATKIARGFSRVAMNPMLWIGSAALPAIQDAAQLIGSAAASAISLASQLGPAIAAGVAVGGSAMLALMTTMGTVMLAFKAKTGELESFAAAMGPVRDAWKGYAEDIQKVLFPALEGASRRLTETMGPTVRDGLVATARSLSGVVGQLANLSENPAFQRRIGAILDSNATALRNFGSAAVHGLAAAADLGASAGPLTIRFSQYANGLAAMAAKHLAAAESSGKLEGFFTRAGNKTAAWGRILGDVGHALFNIFHVGAAEGGSLLGMLENVTTRFEAWTNSTRGENALAKWFRDATPVMSAVGRLLGDLTTGLGNMISPTGTLIDTLDGVGAALPEIGKALGVVGSAGRALIEAVAPAVGMLADRLAPVVADVAKDIADNLGPALDDLVPALGDLGKAAGDVLDSLGPVLPALSKIAVIAAEVLTPAVQGVAYVLDSLPTSVIGVVGAIALLRVAFGKIAGDGKLSKLATSVSEAMGKIKVSIGEASGFGGKFKAGIGGLVGALGGPWTLALGAGITILGYFAQKQKETAAEIDAVKETLDSQTGAITKNTRQWAIKKLSDDGVLQDAKDLGLNLQLVTDAALGQKGAVKELGDQLVALRIASTTATGADVARLGKINDLGHAIGVTSGKIKVARHEQELETEANGKNYDKTRSLVNIKGQHNRVEDQLTRATGRTTEKLKGQRGETDKLTQATLAYHDAAVKLVRGNIGFEQAIDDAAKEIAKGAKTLDIGTQAGRDNMNSLLDLAEAAHGVTGSADKQQAALERARRKIKDFADQAYHDKDKAQALADKLISIKTAADKVPPKVHTTIEVEDRDARHKLMDFSAAFDGLDGRVAKTFVQVTTDHIMNRLGDRVNRAGGGWIYGSGNTVSDSNTYGGANVSNREFVVNAADAQRNASLLEAINSGRTIRGSSGGVVNINVNNPLPERAGQSVSSVLQQHAYNAGWTS